MRIIARGLGKQYFRRERQDTLRGLVSRWARDPLAALRNRPPGFWALEDVSFELGEGQCLGVIGANGSGKSTLLKILASILRPDRGTFEIRGRPLPLIEAGAAFHPELTGLENVLLSASILGYRVRRVLPILDEIVAFAGLEEVIDVPVKRYSSGMSLRLGFSIATHLDPQILLVDEALSVGDLVFRQRCMDRMELLRSQGTSMVLVSHDLHHVRTFCSQVLWLAHGRTAGLGATEDVLASYIERSGEEAQRLDPRAGVETSRIVEVAVIGPDGRRVERIGTGDPLQVAVTLESTRPLVDAVVVLRVETMESSPLFGGSTLAELGPLRKEPGRYHLRCRFPEVPLLPGHYQIRAALAERSMPAASAWHATTWLRVDGPGSASLFPLRIAHEWELREAISVEDGDSGRSLQ